MRQECIDDAEVVSLRDRIEAITNPSVARDQSIVEARFSDGSVVRAQVDKARGSKSQASIVLSSEKVDRLLHLCRYLASLDDVGH